MGRPHLRLGRPPLRKPDYSRPGFCRPVDVAEAGTEIITRLPGRWPGRRSDDCRTAGGRPFFLTREPDAGCGWTAESQGKRFGRRAAAILASAPEPLAGTIVQILPGLHDRRRWRSTISAQPKMFMIASVAALEPELEPEPEPVVESELQARLALAAEPSWGIRPRDNRALAGSGCACA